MPAAPAPSSVPAADGLAIAHRLAVVHPLPSLINTLLVVALAGLAGADAAEALLLGVAMLGFQCSIGALNDLVDVDRDRLTRPRKPIPAGLVGTRGALLVAVAGGAVGLAISAAFGAAVLLLGALGYGCGLTYDLALRARGLGWACFAGAFPLLLAWTWLAASGSLPPAWPLVLPLAALAGPVIHLANSLVDLDADAQTGTPSLARSLGRAPAARLLVALTVIVQLLAWAVLLGQGVAGESLVIAAGATLLGWVGVGLSGHGGARSAEAGWLCQAVAMALLAVAWAAGVHA